MLWRGWEGNEKLLSDNFSSPKTSRVWLLFEPLLCVENRLTDNTGKTEILRFSDRKILQPENHVALGNDHLNLNSECI